MALLVGVLSVAAAGPAAAQTVTRTYTGVHCTAVVNGSTISQNQDVTVSVTAPDRVTPGQVYTVTFPGGTSVLPSSSNGLTITSYSNIFLTYQIHVATFKAGTIVNPGTAFINGNPTPEAASLPTADTIKMGVPGPIPPGTLVTPDISVSVTAGADGSSATINALTLTTNVVLNGSIHANATCQVPQDTIITIPVGATNTPPTVNAGPDVSGNAGASIALNGSVTDPDSTPTDTWTSSDPACTFSDPSAPSTFVTCSTPGTFTVTLTANDGVNTPVSDTAQVVVSQATSLIVDAGGPVSGAISHNIALHGSVSDPGGTPTIAWTVNSPSCTFGNAAVAATTISCNALGSYVATLTAHDGALSQSSTAAVTVNPDVPPTVSAGPDAAGNTKTDISLAGSVSDPDDTPSVLWTASDPRCTFADPTQPVTTINCSVQGNYTATLSANDGFNPTVSKTVPVAVTDILFPFNWNVDATTHLKTLNQDVTVPTGNFKGVVDLTTGQLSGDITLPPASFTFSLAGVGLVTANMQISETQPITGTLDVSTFAVSATAVFDLHIVSIAPTATPTVNLVGNSCKTSTPVSVTMQGTANLTGASTFSGDYTIPPLQNCGLLTTALNLVIPGPGNTFTATVSPPPVPPSVSTQPSDTSVAAGQSYSFSAEAAGYPDPTVQWQVSTDHGSTFSDIPGATDGTYGGTASMPDSGKQFRAVFTNSTGTADTNPAVLTVTNGTTISVGAAAVAEGDTGKSRTATVLVTLSQPASQNVTVHYATANVTASAPTDFVAKSGNLTFKPGKTALPVSVTVKPDTTGQSDKMFQIVLSNPGGGYTLAANHSVAPVTILNDDPNSALRVSAGDQTICRPVSGPATVAKVWVSLSSPATATVTVKITLSAGSATMGTEFKKWTTLTKTLTFNVGQYQKLITVTVNPGFSADDKTALLTLSSPSSGLSIARAVGTITISNHD